MAECFICYAEATKTCSICNNPVCDQHWLADDIAFRELMEVAGEEVPSPRTALCEICQLYDSNSHGWHLFLKDRREQFGQQYEIQKARQQGVSLANEEGEKLLIGLTNAYFEFMKFISGRLAARRKGNKPYNIRMSDGEPFPITAEYFACYLGTEIIKIFEQISLLTAPGYVRIVASNNPDNSKEQVEETLKSLIASTYDMNPEKVDEEWAKAIEHGLDMPDNIGL